MGKRMNPMPGTLHIWESDTDTLTLTYPDGKETTCHRNTLFHLSPQILRAYESVILHRF